MTSSALGLVYWKQWFQRLENDGQLLRRLHTIYLNILNIRKKLELFRKFPIFPYLKWINFVFYTAKLIHIITFQTLKLKSIQWVKQFKKKRKWIRIASQILYGKSKQAFYRAELNEITKD